MTANNKMVRCPNTQLFVKPWRVYKIAKIICCGRTIHPASQWAFYTLLALCKALMALFECLMIEHVMTSDKKACFHFSLPTDLCLVSGLGDLLGPPGLGVNTRHRMSWVMVTRDMNCLWLGAWQPHGPPSVEGPRQFQSQMRSTKTMKVSKT